jgi:hypothetical protein
MRNFAKNTIENLVYKIDRFLDRSRRGHDSRVHLTLACKPNTCNEAGAKIHHSTIEPRHTGVGIKHARPSPSLRAAGRLIPAVKPDSVRPAILVRNQVVDFAQKQFRRKITPHFSAETAHHRDGLKRKRTRARWNVSTASLARDHKLLSTCRSLKHGNRIGEQKANIQWKHVDGFARVLPPVEPT